MKLYESIEKSDAENINRYLHTYRWISDNVRNILDESDAILQPNYQLIYTVGSQSSIDGGERRWKVIQAVLKRISHYMKIYNDKAKAVKEQETVQMEYDDKYLECDRIFGKGKVNYRLDVFPQCRILSETIFDQLKSALINDFLSGQLDIDIHSEMNEKTKNHFEMLLTQEKIEKPLSDVIQSEIDQDTIWILRGLLQCEVFKLVFTKRWRVNYGVDPDGHRKMAIPFKGKDCPTENSEFGHPDVAICLTQLSYYYSGLKIILCP